MFFVFELKCMKLFLFRAVRYFFKIMYFVFINTKKLQKLFLFLAFPPLSLHCYENF
jgi:hypothetical protein